MSLAKVIFGDVADIRDSTAAWPIPFLNGDRDVVPHNNSVLLDNFFCDIVGSLWFAVYTDHFDPIPHSVIQLFCWASFRSYERSARSGGLKKERVLIYACIYIDSSILITIIHIYTLPEFARFKVPSEPSPSPSSVSPSSASPPS
jgi:hypothetical protein